MQSIKLSSYHKSMGTLYNLDNNYIKDSINISYENLLYNKDKLLDKNKTYYIYCNGGYKSRTASLLLNAYGYNVVQVKKD